MALAGGVATSFATLGITLSAFGGSFNTTVLRLAFATLMIAFGAVLLVPQLQARFALAASPVAGGAQSFIDRIQPTGLGGQFILGALLGAVWSPCAGPTLGAAIGLAAQSETALKAATIMGAFSLGATTPILALAYGSRRAIATRRAALARLSAVAKPLMGAVLIGIGAFVLTGLDKSIETVLTRAMPDWLVNVTTRL
jgi:cytochrome c-type biogenesis protein